MNEPTLYTLDELVRAANVKHVPTSLKLLLKEAVPVKMDIDEIVHELGDCVLHGSWGTGCDFDYAEARAIILRIGGDR